VFASKFSEIFQGSFSRADYIFPYVEEPQPPAHLHRHSASWSARRLTCTRCYARQKPKKRLACSKTPRQPLCVSRWHTFSTCPSLRVRACQWNGRRHMWWLSSRITISATTGQSASPRFYAHDATASRVVETSGSAANREVCNRLDECVQQVVYLNFIRRSLTLQL
jgi:hypothetical protein